MFNKKNILPIVLIVLVLVGLSLFFYFNKKTTKEEITIAIWDSYEQEFLQDYFKTFEEKENVKVNIVSIPWEEYWMAVDNSLKNGTGPEIFWMHPDMFEEYVKTGNLLAMDNTLDSDYWQNFRENLLSLYIYNDNHYVVPRDMSSIGLFYNKEIFDKNEIPYPTDSWTWDDLISNANKLTNNSENVYGFLAECWGEDGYYNTIFQNEGFIYDDTNKVWGFNNIETQAGIQFYLDFITKYQTSPTPQEILDIDTNDLFINGKVAMIFRGNWEILSFSSNENFHDKFDVIELPKGKVNATVLNSIGYAASTKSKNPELVEKALLHLSDDLYYKGIAENGLSIPAHKSYQSIWADKYSEYNANSFIRSAEYGYTMPNFTGNRDWKEKEEEIMLQIFSGEKEIGEGLKELSETYESEK